jgi:DNA replication protein DnaC
MSKEYYRRKLYESQIDLAREKIIKKHRKCSGTGYIEKVVEDDSSSFPKRVVEICKCRKNFELASKFIISNIPYNLLVNQQIYGKLVIDSITSETFELRKEILNPYTKQIKKAANNPFGFLFLGKNGTGKTFVGLKILYYAVINGLTAFNLEMTDFLKMGRKIFDNDFETEKVLSEISLVDFLMIDEIGNESKRSPYVVSEFKSLFKKRVSLKKPTILISNFSYKDFREAYGKSVDSMIRSYCKVLDFSNTPDVRKTKAISEMDMFFKKIKRK